jgi:hypothetical protein
VTVTEYVCGGASQVELGYDNDGHGGVSPVQSTWPPDTGPAAQSPTTASGAPVAVVVNDPEDAVPAWHAPSGTTPNRLNPRQADPGVNPHAYVIGPATAPGQVSANCWSGMHGNPLHPKMRSGGMVVSAGEVVQYEGVP